jgi:uncharacterized protein
MVPHPFARIADMPNLTPEQQALRGPASDFVAAIGADEPDPEALRAAVAHAGSLTAPVLALLAEIAAGAELEEDDARFAFFGVHVLAAARRTELWAPLLAALARPGEELDDTFGDAVTETFPSILMAVFDGDLAPARRLLLDPATDGSVRWVVADVVAQLAVDGRIDRDQAVALLRAMPPTIDKEDEGAWLGWHEAVLRLRAAELVPLARTQWVMSKTSLAPADLAELKRDFAALEADPASPPPETTVPIVPMEDPAVALEFGLQGDPAGDVLPDAEEVEWLVAFLTSPACRPTVMDIETIDGFLAGLVAGPGSLEPAAVLREVLDGGFAPGARVAKADRLRCEDIVERLRQSIALRLAAGVEHRPLLLPVEAFQTTVDTAGRAYEIFPGEAWASGFGFAVRLFRREWERAMQESEDVQALMTPISALMTNPAKRAGIGIDAADLRTAHEELPDCVAGLYAYWREVEAEAAARRSSPGGARPGRNDPCPCGSGQKYKRCCGAAA